MLPKHLIFWVAFEPFVEIDTFWVAFELLVEIVIFFVAFEPLVEMVKFEILVKLPTQFADP